MRALPLLFASSLLFTGCPTRDQDPADGSGRDGSSPLNSVSITSPTTTIYTKGSVTIVVTTTQPTSSPIAIVANATSPQTVGTITAPETSFVWNTSGVGEGTYSVTAQLTSNGQAVTSNAVTIVVDRTPPQVVVASLVPAPGASDVVLAAPIEAVFSEPILASTINANAIPIQTAGVTLPTNVSLSSDGETATITITSAKGITLDRVFSGTFASTISDLAGNALTPLSTTWSWTVPAWIKYAPLGSNSPPIVAIGTNYEPIVGYTVCGPGNAGEACPPVMHVAVSDGQAWNDLGVVGEGAAASNAAIFVDAQDHPNVGWGYQTAASVGEVAFATWDGTAWQTTTYPPITLPATAGTNVDAIAVALDATGRPVVASRADIYTSTTTKTDIYVASWTGSDWDTSFGAVGDPTSKTFDLVLDDRGVPIVSVANTDNTSGVFLWSGTSWAFSGGAGATNASVGRDVSGNPVMLNSLTTSWVPDHLTNGTWLPLVSSAVPSSTTATSPSLANTKDWLPVVAWYEPSASPPAIGLARWSGSAWDNRAGFANAGGSPATSPPALIVDARNDIWLGWGENQQINVWMSNY